MPRRPYPLRSSPPRSARHRTRRSRRRRQRARHGPIACRTARVRSVFQPEPFLPVAFAVGALLLLAGWTLADGVAAHRAARDPLATTTPVVRQRHPQGCGAALLATLLARHGLPGTEAALLGAAPPGPAGISLAALADLAARFGLEGRWRRAHARRLPEPGFVAHLGRPDGHFVYVEARAGTYLHVLDPASGASVWHVDLFRSRWTGRYLRLAPS